MTIQTVSPAPVGAVSTPAFCHGSGQFDTRKHDGNQYGAIGAREIVRLAQQPPSVDKADAPWFIPSTYRSHDARSHDAQRQHGQFWFLAADVDTNNLTLHDVREALASVLGDTARIIYSTRSSTESNRKWRALIPLKSPIPGGDYADTATAFYDLLEETSGGVLIPDRALARPGQLIYLPNRGDFYQHEIHRAPRTDLTAEHPVIARRDQTRRLRAAAEAEARAWRASKAIEAPTASGSIVNAFNEANSIADLLSRYGYTRAGQSNDWRSPHQTSRSFATRTYDGYWISLSASDAAAGLGAATASGHRFGDAFDLFVAYEHGGNFNQAVRAYAEAIGRTNNIASKAAPDEPVARSDPDDYDLSHDALANDLGARGWDSDAKFVHAWNRWLFWTGTHWRRDDTLEHMTRCREFLRTRANEVLSWAERKAATTVEPEKGAKLRAWAKDQARALRNKSTVAAVENLARSNAASVAAIGDFDSNRILLGTPGGTVDLSTGKIDVARREHMNTKTTSVAPASGTPVRWLQFLNEVFNSDQDMIEFVQRVAGYALTGETREHKAFFLYGTGRNGKSVLINTLFRLWGDYARRAPATTFLNTAGESHPTDLAGLQGARLVAASEIPRGRSWDEATIKDLTGGDTITARFMRGDFFDFEPQLTLFIVGNTQPSFRGVDEAIRSRIVLIPFETTIPPERRDTHLEDKLAAEGPMILQWAIEGAAKWLRDGLKIPASVAAASTEYLDDEDTIAQFLADETVSEPGAFVTTTDLHQRFRQWCEVQGLQSWTLRTLQKEVRSKGVMEGRRSYGRGFIGIKLR